MILLMADIPLAHSKKQFKMNITSDIIQFKLPEGLSCPLPTEERNIARDEIRMLVTKRYGSIYHTRFKHIDEYLQKGDVLVVNTSATMPSSFPVVLPGNRKGVVNFSTQLADQKWLVEIREIRDKKSFRWKEGDEYMEFRLSTGVSIKLKERFYNNHQLLDLWIAELTLDQDVQSFIMNFGQPIKYEGLDKHYPLDYFQTFFSFHPGSSEMPSAGRGFTQSVVNKLLKKGIIIAPIMLHTGISSLEDNEPPYPEYYEIDPISASKINSAKENGNRIIAVGTTAVRAVESATSSSGKVIHYKGYTDLYIKSHYQMKTITNLLTGFHEPKASHLHMLQAIAGFEHIEMAYKEAIKFNYYWHQFGDVHLIL